MIYLYLLVRYDVKFVGVVELVDVYDLKLCFFWSVGLILIIGILKKFVFYIEMGFYFYNLFSVLVYDFF